MFKNLLLIFNILEKKYIFLIFSLIPIGIIGLILELFSIAAFVPLLQQSFLDSNIYSNIKLYKISNLIINYVSNINLLLIVSLFIFILKNIYIIFQSYYFLSITKKIYVFITDKIFLNKISQDYLTFYKKSSSHLIKDLRETTLNFRNYLESLIFFFIEIAVSLLIISFLLIIYFDITIIVLSFFILVVYLLIYFSRNFIKKIGNKQNETAEKLNSMLINSFNNFTDIKIYNRTSFFQRLYKESNIIFAECLKKTIFVYSISKPIIELLALSIFIIFLLNIKSYEFTKYIGVLGLFLIAFYRLLPSAIRISNLKMQMNNLSFSVKIVCDIMKIFKEKKNL